MKKISLVLPLLLLTFSIVGCKDDDDDFNVPYSSCSCNNKDFVRQFQGYAYLFNNSIPEDIEEDLRQKGYSEGTSLWIVYDQAADSATLYGQDHHSIRVIYGICNYPSYAKNWTIPENGKQVYFESNMYNACVEIYGTNISSSDLILTFFKPK